MDLFSRFYNMQIGVVDLTESLIELRPLSNAWLLENVGGAGIHCRLMNEYPSGETLILGVGPLTGSFAPASCLLIATFRSPISGQLCHVPLMLRSGPEMKFSGIDFVVIQGRAPRPQSLYISDGTIKLLPADHIGQSDIPNAMSLLKQAVHAPFRMAILIGPAANCGVSQASVSIETCGSLDKTGLAHCMASRNLKAIILNGTGGLPFGDENLAMGHEMVGYLMTDPLFKRKGFISMLDWLGAENKVRRLVVKSKKNLACYHCCFPCMSHMEFLWRDPRNKDGRRTKEGLILLDHMGFMALARKRGRDSLVLMKECLRLGLNTSFVAETLPHEGTLENALDFMAEMAGLADKKGEKIGVYESHITNGPNPGGIPLGKYALFGGGIPPISQRDTENDPDFWEKRVAMSMILGICPIFLLLFPRISAEDLLGFISNRKDDVQLLEENISHCIQLILMN